MHCWPFGGQHASASSESLYCLNLHYPFYPAKELHKYGTINLVLNVLRLCCTLLQGLCKVTVLHAQHFCSFYLNLKGLGLFQSGIPVFTFKLQASVTMDIWAQQCL